MPTVLSDDDDGLFAACLLLRTGRQVVIPTETVYGIAANALDYDAVAEIFHIKGRPATNPLIVHVHSLEHASLIANVNERAEKLAKAFWPGPLTIVMEALENVADNVTAGGGTVGIRIPNHATTLRLLKMSNLPLAAPSANRSEGISPTTADDVMRSLGESTPPIIDGGPCVVGIESTVIDVTASPARILRLGAITRSQIEAELGEPVELGGDFAVQRSPGQTDRHYAPNIPATLTTLSPGQVPYPEKSSLLYFSDAPIDQKALVATVKLPSEPIGYAAGLYAGLHELDRSGASQILIETPPESEEWAAIRDRLTRATAQKPA